MEEISFPHTVGDVPSADGDVGAPLTKRPMLPANFFKFPIRSRLKAVQQFISSFEYKQTPQTSFNAHKLRPLIRIMETAKMMVYNPQPIKCVEAVFLALYLTAGMLDVERIPLGFKTRLKEQVHQHIVLIVRYGGKYGAFGISRNNELMNKELEFTSISSLVVNYKNAYEQSEHQVLRIRVGLPVEHNTESFNYVCWRFLSLDPSILPWEQCCHALEKHAKEAKRLWDRWLLDGQRENKRADLCLKRVEMKLSLVEKSMKKRQPGFTLSWKTQALKEIQSPLLKSLSSIGTSVCAKSKAKYLEAGPLRAPSRSAKQCLKCQNMVDGTLVSKLSDTIQKKVCKKIVMKCYSLELLSDADGSFVQKRDRPRHKLLSHHLKRNIAGFFGNGMKRPTSEMPLNVVSTSKPLLRR